MLQHRPLRLVLRGLVQDGRRVLLPPTHERDERKLLPERRLLRLRFDICRSPMGAADPIVFAKRTGTLNNKEEQRDTSAPARNEQAPFLFNNNNR
jgi:hypothetical protein